MCIVCVIDYHFSESTDLRQFSMKCKSICLDIFPNGVVVFLAQGQTLYLLTLTKVKIHSWVRPFWLLGSTPKLYGFFAGPRYILPPNSIEIGFVDFTQVKQTTQKTELPWLSLLDC